MPFARAYPLRSITTHNLSRSRVLPGLWFLLLGLLLSGAVFAQGLDARLDRTRVAEGDTVTLTLSATGDVQGSPDLQPLTADFDIVGQSQGTSISIIDGRTSTTRQWQLALLPKHQGELHIPALQLGKARSQALTLNVVPETSTQGATAGGTDRPVRLEVEATPKNPYVQGEVNYRVRILSRVPLRDATLTGPRAGDAIVEQVGEDKQYTTQRNGETWQVVERNYALFPQHSGSLTIESPVLNAAVPVQGGQRQSLRQRFFGNDPFADIEKMLGSSPFAGFADMDSLFARTRPVRVRDHDIRLDVRPQPAAAQGNWLPAKNLTLTESWSPEPPVFRVGEPVTRSVTLIANGVSAAQLPDLQLPAPAGIKRYPDQPQTETRASGGDLVAVKTFKTALVPTTPGTLTLPAVKVQWWDTQSQQARTATLPARSVQVLPGAAGSSQGQMTASAPQNPPMSAAEPATTPPSATQTPLARTAWWRPALTYWPWIAALALAGWLVLLLLWWQARRAAKQNTALGDDIRSGSVRTGPSLADSRNQVKQACAANDPKAARAALLAWGAARWPDQKPRGLASLAPRLPDGAARSEVLALDRALYDAQAGRDWDGPRAWAALEPVLKVTASGDSASNANDALPGLYPRHS